VDASSTRDPWSEHWRHVGRESFAQGVRPRRDALWRFDCGRLLVNMIDTPIKCPVAPVEFCFLAARSTATPQAATSSSPRPTSRADVRPATESKAGHDQ
jgi:hypothetical protein